MSGMFWAGLGAAIGLLVPLAWRLWQRGGTPAGTVQAAGSGRRPRRTSSTGHSSPAAKPPSGLNRKLIRKFHGVSIRPGVQACKAAQELVGQRFLPAEAPAIPLTACDRDKCQCAYSHHGDRRDQEDRRSGWGTFGGFSPSVPGGNRRSKRVDRRSGRQGT